MNRIICVCIHKNQSNNNNNQPTHIRINVKRAGSVDGSIVNFVGKSSDMISLLSLFFSATAPILIFPLGNHFLWSYFECALFSGIKCRKSNGNRSLYSKWSTRNCWQKLWNLLQLNYHVVWLSLIGTGSKSEISNFIFSAVVYYFAPCIFNTGGIFSNPF